MSGQGPACRDHAGTTNSRTLALHVHLPTGLLGVANGATAPIVVLAALAHGASVSQAGLVVAGGENPERASYTVSFKPGAGEWTALGVQVVQDDSLPANRLARGADRFVLTEVDASAKSANARSDEKLHFVLATTDGAGEPIENPPLAALDGNPKTGWAMQFADGRDAFVALRLQQPLRTDDNTTITVRLRQESDVRRATIGRFRLALSAARHSWPDHQAKLARPLNGLPADLLPVLQTPLAERTANQKKALWSYFKWVRPELEPLVVRVAALEAERDQLDAQIPRVMITEATTPAVTRVLARGNFLDESGEIVGPAIPAVFGRLNLGLRRASRLDLANWLAAPDNSLTARVFVNRLWRQFFGTGLTKTLDDLGSQGEWPTHPELLDWLASEFLHPTFQAETAHDWDVKHVIRLIVTSHTYRQSSNPQSQISNLKSEDHDPDNRLLARQNRYRVDAEIVRDIALSVSGLLVEKFGGPSIRPVQPDRYLATLNFPVRDYSPERGENLYRRGVYVHWQRTFLHPSLSTFDAPSREECTVNRTNSNTPLQALVLLNDPIFVEAARVFAQNALKQGGATIESQIAWAFERATGRKPSIEEIHVLSELHQKSLAGFLREPESARELASVGDAPVISALNPAKLAAMVTVTRAILNLHETITRN